VFKQIRVTIPFLGRTFYFGACAEPLMSMSTVEQERQRHNERAASMVVAIEKVATDARRKEEGLREMLRAAQDAAAEEKERRLAADRRRAKHDRRAAREAAGRVSAPLVERDIDVATASIDELCDMGSPDMMGVTQSPLNRPLNRFEDEEMAP
jgi:septal ring factor EnvC (AmiA/AmiB activator)